MSSQYPLAMAQPLYARPRRGGAWRVIRRILLLLLVALVVVAALGAGAGYVFIERTLPQTSGSLTVAGLSASVSVVRDGYGVPHITATSLHDVAFAQGYVTAQDRLFQMELNRRIAQGRLAEIFGSQLVDTDAFLRTLDLPDAAQAELASLDDASKQELQAYADGVNAFLTSHQNSLPLEFSILGFAPQPWQPVDSLAYARVLSETLDGKWFTKYTRALVQAKLGASVLPILYPLYPPDNPTLIHTRIRRTPDGAGDVATLATGRTTLAQSLALAPLIPAPGAPDLSRGAGDVRALLGGIADSLDSNNWVVDGSLTASDKPLLANDPHLGLQMPAVWYEVALRGGGLDVIGFSLPGIPGVIIGHNDYIAWGVTNVEADNTDLYLETLDPTNHPGQYFYEGSWQPLKVRHETIKVRGGSPVSLTVSATDHGPLMNSVDADIKSFAPVALAWTALQPGYTFRGFLQLDQARNWDDFTGAVEQISINQNFVYADTSGNIGCRMSGLLPLRNPENHDGPVPGNTADHDWHGYVPQDQMPSLFNPSDHMIVTANNQIVDDAADIYVSRYWDYGYRARRITDVLQKARSLTPADMARLQSDIYSLPASSLASRFVGVSGSLSGDAGAAGRILSSWDFNMTRGSAGAAIYEVTAGLLAREVIEPVLGADLYGIYISTLSTSGLYTVLIDLLADPQPPFFADSSARDAAIVRALTNVMATLRSTLGDDSTKWTWGALHQAHFEHPLASVKPLDLLFGVGALTRPGDGTTVNSGGAGGFSADPPSYQQQSGPSMRMIVDMSTFDASLWVTTTGESGQPLSAHYSDLMPLWDQGQYQPMHFSVSAVGQDAHDVLTMEPK
ncbi:MAG TPA: penicillin acylase family protein [Ktedonobacterales bacterium]